MLSLSIKFSNEHRRYGPRSSKRVVLWDTHLIFDQMQLSAVEESIVLSLSYGNDYILEINLTKMSNGLRMLLTVLFSFIGPI